MIPSSPNCENTRNSTSRRESAEAGSWRVIIVPSSTRLSSISRVSDPGVCRRTCWSACATRGVRATNRSRSIPTPPRSPHGSARTLQVGRWHLAWATVSRRSQLLASPTALVLGAALVSGVSGYLALIVAARTLTKADSAHFLVFWGVVFAMYGALNGVTTEVTRAVSTTRDASSGRTRPVPVAIGFGLVLVAVVGISGFLWAPPVYGPDWAPAARRDGPRHHAVQRARRGRRRRHRPRRVVGLQPARGRRDRRPVGALRRRGGAPRGRDGLRVRQRRRVRVLDPRHARVHALPPPVDAARRRGRPRPAAPARRLVHRGRCRRPCSSWASPCW